MAKDKPDRTDKSAAPDPAAPPPPPGSSPPGRPYSYEEILRRRVIAEAFQEDNPHRRDRLGLPSEEDMPTPIMVELNLLHPKGLQGAERRFLDVYARLARLVGGGGPKPVKIADTYYRAEITIHQAELLVKLDELDGIERVASLATLEEEDEGRPRIAAKERSIYRVWPDFNVSPQIDISVATVKADAARRSFGASGVGITWAVIDSGIDENHPHFKTHDTLGGDVAQLHRDFTVPDLSATPSEAEIEASVRAALKDVRGHGTHVAGIIAGALFDPMQALLARENGATPPRYCVARRTGVGVQERPVEAHELDRFTGVAPRCKLVSLKVLPDTQTRNSDSSSNVLRALQYIRQKVNGEGKIQRIHGVNLSVGYEFDAKWFACGQSPICVEVDRLVRSGVVVVVAAGNTGYGSLTSKEGITSTGLSLTINDPGNAALAITVGATHRDSPYTYGVSFFSSKGPTGDGRLKPDLVAPGERISSCAVGNFRREMDRLLKEKFKDDAADPNIACYIDHSGTSMAAPHVSGAAADLLSIRREFIGRPEEIKRILLATATSLGRERYFEGHGLVDLMRAIQSI